MTYGQLCILRLSGASQSPARLQLHSPLRTLTMGSVMQIASRFCGPSRCRFGQIFEREPRMNNLADCYRNRRLLVSVAIRDFSSTPSFKPLICLQVVCQTKEC